MGGDAVGVDGNIAERRRQNHVRHQQAECGRAGVDGSHDSNTMVPGQKISKLKVLQERFVLLQRCSLQACSPRIQPSERTFLW